MLLDWLSGHGPDEPIFPRLDRKKTWLMVKKDLERVDIEYETPEGIADFHAAGRHTHVTELLRSGATLPEARQLARHSDVRMTMRHTHIGLQDQAKALAGLRVPKATGKKKEKAEKQTWQR
jgi:integrase